MKKRNTARLIRTIIAVAMLLVVVSCGDQGKKDAANSSTAASTATTTAKTNESVTASLTKGRFTPKDIADVNANAYKEGQLLVKFKDDITSTRSLTVHRALNAKVVKTYSLVKNLELVTLPASLSVKEAVKQYMQHADVQYAEPNYYAQGLDVMPNDPYFAVQWALYNTGQKNGTPGADIKAYKAWDVTKGDKNVIVAVLDTGVDYNHPDLGGNIWNNTRETFDGLDNDSNGYVDDIRGWDFVGNDLVDPKESNNPMDVYGHGTHVAGTIGAIGNNSTGVAGVSWDVTIMPVKILNSDLKTTMDALISGIQYATKNGAKIINASLGWKNTSQAIYNAIASARDAGVLLVAAAGNGGSSDNIYCNGSLQNDNDLSPCYPASYNLENIIAVAASDQNDTLASFSNYGVISVDVSAPGVDICSTITGYNSGTIYSCTYSGTSMAAPHVSGLTALLWAYYPHFSVAQIKQMVESYTDPMASPYNTMTRTGGRVNAWKSLSALWSPSDLKVVSTSAGYVVLNWVDRATAENGFLLYRRLGDGPYVQYKALATDTQSFVDTDTIVGQSYTYKLVAYNSIGVSPNSNEAIVQVVAPPPPSSGGGGGCSIAGTSNSDNDKDSTDVLAIMLPIALALLIRLRRFGRIN
ncbi:S8 family serine peptidase [Candidatus Magnetobacterium casense]|uniref:S8 family serine peptidase n=1 Tax=Candidatus Magnetobacterium casense TaxID=1455061 RepID=A0ABS6RVA8_9BACT|nr:S8 family serine peptidase [Candidatus Magnetobacterium casensis]MBV6340561.1 S8 family serine peptidase [Candidatus Magnetobacterium casensis]